MLTFSQHTIKDPESVSTYFTFNGISRFSVVSSENTSCYHNSVWWNHHQLSSSPPSVLFLSTLQSLSPSSTMKLWGTVTNAHTHSTEGWGNTAHHWEPCRAGVTARDRVAPQVTGGWQCWLLGGGGQGLLWCWVGLAVAGVKQEDSFSYSGSAMISIHLTLTQ